MFDRELSTEFEAEIKKEFEKLPPQISACIALRAAMRVLPMLATDDDDEARPFTYWPEEDSSRHLLAIFQVYEATVFINGLINTERATRAALDAFDARAAATRAAFDTTTTTTTATFDARVALATATDAAHATRATRAALDARVALATATNARAARATRDALDSVDARAAHAAHVALATAHAALATAYTATTTAIQNDLSFAKKQNPEAQSFVVRIFGTPQTNSVPSTILALLQTPLWPDGMPTKSRASCKNFQRMPCRSMPVLISGSTGTGTDALAIHLIWHSQKNGCFCLMKDARKPLLK